MTSTSGSIPIIFRITRVFEGRRTYTGTTQRDKATGSETLTSAQQASRGETGRESQQSEYEMARHMDAGGPSKQERVLGEKPPVVNIRQKKWDEESLTDEE